MKEKTMVVVKSDGTTFEVAAKRASDDSVDLQQLQGLVGGMIELVQPQTATLRGADIWVNEEGLIHRLPFNRVASAATGVPLVGDVVIVPTAKRALHAIRSVVVSAGGEPSRTSLDA